MKDIFLFRFPSFFDCRSIIHGFNFLNPCFPVLLVCNLHHIINNLSITKLAFKNHLIIVEAYESILFTMWGLFQDCERSVAEQSKSRKRASWWCHGTKNCISRKRRISGHMIHRRKNVCFYSLNPFP